MISQNQKKHFPQKWGFYIAIWYYQNFVMKTHLGKILEHFEVVSVQDELLYLDLNRWFKRKILKHLSSVHVELREFAPAELIVLGNTNLAAILYPPNDDDFDEDGLEDTEVTPIQKDVRKTIK